jgi:hypothetical protein
VITHEFEETVDEVSFDRSVDGRLVPQRVLEQDPDPEPEQFASIRQTGDLDITPISLPEVAPAEGWSLERHWRELVFVGASMLILFGLIVIFLARDRDSSEVAGGDGVRIESTGDLPSDVLPRAQTQFGEPDVNGASGDARLQSFTTSLSSDGLPSDGPVDSSTGGGLDPAGPGASDRDNSGASTTTTIGPTSTSEASTTTSTTVVTVPPPPIEASLLNGGFDDTPVERGGAAIVGSIPGWISATGDFEIWHKDKGRVGAADGDYVLELNANGQGLIYQDFATTPGSTIRWSFAHRGRGGKEEVEVLLGSPGGSLESVKVAKTRRRWKRYDGKYDVPEGQTTTRLVFRSLEPGSSGNFLDAISVTLQDNNDDDD